MSFLNKLKSHKKKVLVATATTVVSAYLGLCSPTFPYLIQDVAEKNRTSQRDPIEISKSLYGAFVWYPKNKLSELGNSSLERKVVVVNKASQELFMYSANGELELRTNTSTGRHQGIKRSEAQKVTPFGKYIAVERWNSPQELEKWYGSNLAPQYGEGGMLFLGKWFPHIAIHGTTPEREKLLGTNVSNGCPRLDSDSMDMLLENAATGTTLTVHEYAILPRELPEGFSFEDYRTEEFSGVVVSEVPSLEHIKSDFLEQNPFVNSPDKLIVGETYFFRDQIIPGSYEGDNLIGGVDNYEQ